MSKTREILLSIEQTENGYTVTVVGNPPFYCKNEESVQEYVQKKTHAFCKMSEVIDKSSKSRKR